MTAYAGNRGSDARSGPRGPYVTTKTFDENGLKECNRCGIAKTRLDFHASGKTATGYSYYCKDCAKALKAESAERRKAGIRLASGRPVSVDSGAKTCPRCEISKPLSDYYASSSSASGVQSKCKTCQTELAAYHKAKNGPIIVPKAGVQPIGTRQRAERAVHPVIDGMKVCITCEIDKPVSDYGLTKRGFYKPRCKQCHAQSMAQKREFRKIYNEAPEVKAARRAVRRAYDFERKYGITPNEYDKRLAAQGGVCAICSCPPDQSKHGVLHVDHCHGSLQFRGLLCDNCNVTLGKFNDDPDRFMSAAAYLLQYMDVLGKVSNGKE